MSAGLFSYISMNWRGKPLISHQVIISLIAASRTGSGRNVHVRLDEAEYSKGIKITDKQLEDVNLHGHAFHPEWNYTVSPSPPAAAGREDSAVLALVAA